eukprot:TRINITY_DN560_c0_g2_i10.p1 TRINITY_DN560_c0_g2~~TRINITY_DN560_c0_g2_i10.p1  ORF type:complete len:718 (+),score=116.30 TRINITY_DN560_c0_g2_i10:88-2241(+)
MDSAIEMETSGSQLSFHAAVQHMISNPRFVILLASVLEGPGLDSMAKIIHTFAHRIEAFLPMMEALIKNAFETMSITPGAIIRNEDIISRLISLEIDAIKLPATSYLQEAIGSVINAMLENPQDSFEIDPSKVAMQLSLEQNQANSEKISKVVKQNRIRLETTCNKIISGLQKESSMMSLPRTIRAICYIIGSCAQKHMPDSIAPMIGGFYMLKFVNPAIINPDKKGIIKSGVPIPTSVRRNLILLSKVLQGLASGVSFGSKEPFMAEMQQYINSSTARMNRILLDTTSDVTAADPDNEWPEFSKSGNYHKLESFSEEDLSLLVSCQKQFVSQKDAILQLSTRHPEFKALLESLITPVAEDAGDFADYGPENDSLEYTKLKDAASHKDFAAFEDMKFLLIGGTDLNGFTSISVYGHSFPAASADLNLVTMYIIWKLDPIVSKPYSVFFFQSGASAHNRPPFGWMKKFYLLLGRKYKKNMKSLVIIHSSFWTKLSINCFLPFVSGKFWSKVKYASTLHELNQFIEPSHITIPDIAIKCEQGLLEQAPQHAPPTQGLFGIPLSYLMGEEYAAPDFVKECVAFLREHGASVEGIFRITGSSSEVSQLQKDFDEGKLSSIPESTDPHVVAGLLKIFFRQLPEPLLTYELYEEFTQLTALENSKVKIQKLSMLISHLPPAHYATLQALSELLVEVAKKSSRQLDDGGQSWDMLRSKSTESSS